MFLHQEQLEGFPKRSGEEEICRETLPFSQKFSNNDHSFNSAHNKKLKRSREESLVHEECDKMFYDYRKSLDIDYQSNFKTNLSERLKRLSDLDNPFEYQNKSRHFFERTTKRTPTEVFDDESRMKTKGFSSNFKVNKLDDCVDNKEVFEVIHHPPVESTQMKRPNEGTRPFSIKHILQNQYDHKKYLFYDNTSKEFLPKETLESRCPYRLCQCKELIYETRKIPKPRSSDNRNEERRKWFEDNTEIKTKYNLPLLTNKTNHHHTLKRANKKRRRHRTAFTPTQLLGLENSFERGHYIVGDERKQLAAFLRLSETQIKVWFQNRRTKHKRQSNALYELSDSEDFLEYESIDVLSHSDQ